MSKHSSNELRQLADELWDRGFKEIADYVHQLARNKEEEIKKELGFMDFLNKELDDFNNEINRILGG